MKKTVAIVDYKMGNLFSVQQACINVGLTPKITSDKNTIKESDAVILPGVGAFAEAMKNLKNLDLVDTLRGIIESTKPFMGVCLGFQLLFSESEEFGTTKGLDIFKGKVRKFTSKLKIKVPQIGWNQIYSFEEHKWKNSLLNGIKYGEYMYFVHSYFVETIDKNILLSITDYEGIKYCSSIQFENVFASQFHPEKSACEGIKIYQNFVHSIKR